MESGSTITVSDSRTWYGYIIMTSPAFFGGGTGEDISVHPFMSLLYYVNQERFCLDLLFTNDWICPVVLSCMDDEQSYEPKQFRPRFREPYRLRLVRGLVLPLRSSCVNDRSFIPRAIYLGKAFYRLHRKIKNTYSLFV